MSINPELLQLCENEFLHKLSATFLAQHQIITWQKTFGARNLLENVKSQQFSAVVVDLGLNYSRDSLLAWARVLREGGILILEGNLRRLAQTIAFHCSAVFEVLEPSSPFIWVFRKKAVVEISTVQVAQSELPVTAVSNNHRLQVFDHLAQCQPQMQGFLVPLLAKMRIYQQHNLPYAALNELQHYLDNQISPMVQLDSLVYRAALDDKYYPSVFRERKKLFDIVGAQKRTQTVPDAFFWEKRWNGESLENCTIVMWDEFGLGDEIMTAQLAYYLKTAGAKQVICVAQTAIVRLLQSSLDIDEVWDICDANAKLQSSVFDFWTFPSDILAFIDQPFSRVRKRSPYLFAEPTLIEQLKPYFPHKGKPKIGIAWRGNTSHENDRYRSIHQTEYLESLFQLKNIDWYCIQKVCREDEIALLEKYQIPHITKDFTDFAETAAAMSYLDYFIGTCTSCSHLAGAMGVPTFLLLNYISDWRWGLDGEHNLWYPNMLSLRCEAPLVGWGKVIEQLKEKLSQL